MFLLEFYPQPHQSVAWVIPLCLNKLAVTDGNNALLTDEGIRVVFLAEVELLAIGLLHI